ncbi:MAG: hypothetical protein KBT03_06975, partial [Bacteroidales bacterium]|nr:hypothetical protein [Candidatus Scybalousia scybalohippi]
IYETPKGIPVPDPYEIDNYSKYEKAILINSAAKSQAYISEKKSIINLTNEIGSLQDFLKDFLKDWTKEEEERIKVEKELVSNTDGSDSARQTVRAAIAESFKFANPYVRENEKYAFSKSFRNPYKEGLGENDVIDDELSQYRLNLKGLIQPSDNGILSLPFGFKSITGEELNRAGKRDDSGIITWNTLAQQRFLSANGKDGVSWNSYVDSLPETFQKENLNLRQLDSSTGLFKNSIGMNLNLDSKTQTKGDESLLNELQNLYESAQLRESDDKVASEFAGLFVDSTGSQMQSADLLNADGSLKSWKELIDTLKDAGSEYTVIANKLADIQMNQDGWNQSMVFSMGKLMDLSKTFKSTISGGIMNGLSSSLEMWGEMAHQGESFGNILDAIKKNWINIAASMMKALGPEITSTGLAMVKAGFTQVGGINWGLVSAGMALAASGGIMSFTSGMFGDSGSKDKDDDKERKIQNLKDALSDLIDQAKTDAEYYQRNLLHKNALAENEAISSRSVNDAIITPNGSVVTTHPDDYLIATKTPGSLLGNGGKNTTYAPNITFTVVNESGQLVKIGQTETTTNDNGDIDIRATIIAVTEEAIANGELDNAFTAMQYRQQGVASVTG